MPLPRRIFLALIPALVLPRRARAATPAATVVSATSGAVAVLPDGSEVALSEGMALPAGSRIVTAPGARAGIALADGSLVNTAAESRLDLVAGAAEDSVSSLNLSGAALVDRRRVATPAPLTVATADFEATLQEARAYVSSTEGGKVLVKDGAVGVSRPFSDLILLAAGEGYEPDDGPLLQEPPPPPVPGEVPDMAPAPRPAVPPPSSAAPGRGPAEVFLWSEDEMDAAFESVGLEA